MDFQISATASEIRKACLDIDSILKKWSLSENEVTDIVLSVDEALTNIVTHGFQNFTAANKEIKIELFKNLSGVHIILTDSAKPFSLDRISNPEIKDRIKNKVIGGLGVFIINNLMTSVRLTRIKNQNVLWISKEIESFKNFKQVITRETKTINLKYESVIFHIQVKKGSIIEKSDATEHLNIIGEIIESNSLSQNYGILLNTRGIKNISREAQKYYSNNHLKPIKAMAIVVESILTQWIGSIIIGLNKNNDKEVRMFNREKDAFNWLNDFLLPKATPYSDLSKYTQKF